MPTVSRTGRALDFVGLVVFLAGAALFARAWVGLRGVPDFQRSPGGAVMAATEYAEGFVRIQRAGGVLMACAVAVFVVAWWLERRRPDSERVTPPGGT